MNRLTIVSIAIFCILFGCAGPPGPSQAGGGAAGRPQAPKRIILAMGDDPPALSQRINTAGSASVEGASQLEQLVRAGAASVDDRGNLHPRVAEVVPTTDNGLWRVFPDGRMETTWRIREGAQWHDGTPLTSHDFTFALSVVGDPDMAIFRNSPTNNALRALEGIDTPDARTFTVRWKEPFIQADSLFTHDLVYPMPKHLLETTFLQDKATFTQAPYWNVEFVGNGPFKLRDWVRGSHLVLEAFDQYPLGRPRIDELEVRFIPDPNTLIANLLGGQVELTLHSLSLEQAMLLREQWKGGTVQSRFNKWTAIFPQLLDPTPPVVGESDFRRALLHAVDRQQMVDVLMGGLVPVAHMYLGPTEPGFQEIERTIPRYDYDPRRATQLIEGLGYTRAPDGGFRDSSNQRLSVEIRASAGRDLAEKAMFAVADYWQRLGLAVEPVVIPVQRARDREYLATFPAFEMLENNPNESWRLARFTSPQIPTAENRWVGSNRIRYRSAEYDALAERYFKTIPTGERLQVLGQLMHRMADRVLLMGLFYGMETTMVANRVKNVTAGDTLAWNAQEWDVQ